MGPEDVANNDTHCHASFRSGEVAWHAFCDFLVPTSLPPAVELDNPALIVHAALEFPDHSFTCVLTSGPKCAASAQPTSRLMTSCRAAPPPIYRSQPRQFHSLIDRCASSSPTVPILTRITTVYVHNALQVVCWPGMQPVHSFPHPATTPYPAQTPPTTCQRCLQTLPTIAVCVSHSPTTTPATPIMGMPTSYGPKMTSVGGGQTCQAMRGGGTVLRDVLLHGPAGVTLAPAELARNNPCYKLPPIPSHVPPRQATFFGVQSVPVADGSGQFATICVPLRAGVPVSMPTRPVYPPSGIAPLIAGHHGLPRGELMALTEQGDEVAEWKEHQRTKERADIVVKDGELSQAEKLEMEKQSQLVALLFWGEAETDCGLGAACMHSPVQAPMSVKVVNHIYYGADNVPNTQSLTQTTRQLYVHRFANRLITQVVSSTTVPLHFNNSLNIDLNKFQTNSVPSPRIHAPLATNIPIVLAAKATRGQNPVGELTHSRLEPDHQMAKCDLRSGKFTASCLPSRGDTTPDDPQVATKSIKTKRAVQFVDHNLRILSSTSTTPSAWSCLEQSFDSMYSKHTFTHWHVSQGMEEGEFSEAHKDLTALKWDYEASVSSTDGKEAWDWY